MEIPPVAAGALALAGVSVVNAALATLRRVCGPAAEQLGLTLGDKVAAWRARNLISCMRKTEELLTKNEVPEESHAHPRVVGITLEQMALMDDPVVQDMWAGLLASSCTGDGDDDSNLIFVNLLSNMTKLQARILKEACEHAVVHFGPSGLVTSNGFVLSVDRLFELLGSWDLQRLDRELDALREMGLIGSFSGLHAAPVDSVDITPTTLALHMYIRAHGSRKEPREFFRGRPYSTVIPDYFPGQAATQSEGSTKN